MNNQKTLIGLAIAILLGLFSYTLISNSSSPVVAATPNPAVQTRKFKYARLLMNSNQEVFWSDGVRILTNKPVTIPKMIGLMRGIPTQKDIANLLNVIGNNGWELAWFNENDTERVWMFKQ